jgi:phage terminase Nu1 subunit (DNA packaging protein)
MAEGVPAKTLAVLLDMDERVVRRLAAEGIIVRAGRNQYLLAHSVRNYVRHLREIAAARQGNELNAVDENARLKIVQRNLELKNAALEGTLVSVADLTDAWGAIVRTIKAMVLSIPARCQEEMPHLRFEDFEKFRLIVRAVLTEASEIMPDEPPIPDGPDATIATPLKRGRPPGPSTSLRPDLTCDIDTFPT